MAHLHEIAACSGGRPQSVRTRASSTVTDSVEGVGSALQGGVSLATACHVVRET
jgi:hypothetical protein